MQRLRRTPPVRLKILGREPHRGDLAATGPAGPRRPQAAGGVEPDGRGHLATTLLSVNRHKPKATRFTPDGTPTVAKAKQTTEAIRSSQEGEYIALPPLVRDY
jgi:hypothetical protein